METFDPEAIPHHLPTCGNRKGDFVFMGGISYGDLVFFLTEVH